MGLQPEALEVAVGHVALRAIPMGEATRARISSRPKPLPRVKSGSMVQLQLGSALISVACVMSGDLWNHAR